jgi:YD repeat-containing protein
MAHKSTKMILATAALALGTTACLGPARSKARVTEIESVSRYGGTDSGISRAEYDYRDNGFLDEITNTFDGDFNSRIELEWENDRVVELTQLTDDEITIVDLSWDGDLLVEMFGSSPDHDNTLLVDFSYYRDDARYLERVRTTNTTGDSYVTEVTQTYSYDDRSRISEIVANNWSENSFSNTTTESKTETQFRYDADSGDLERVTVISESLGTSNSAPPVNDPPVEGDLCAEYGWYGDGVCDSDCAMPDPDCGEAETPSQPSSTDRDTVIYSVEYDDEGKLEEVLAPGGMLYMVDYNDEGLVDEVEARNDGNSQRWEYEYDEGEVRGYSFSPPVPFGNFFDVKGTAFGTMDPDQMSLGGL